MGHEIERKFLVRSGMWQAAEASSYSIRQGYLTYNGALSIRVRIKEESRAMLTIKTSAAQLRRHEFEYAIPIEDAAILIELCRGAIIRKTRHEIPCGDLKWEIDVFQGDNEGLVIAEIELEHEEQMFERPSWLGEEITGDARYYNFSLAARPYAGWSRA